MVGIVGGSGARQVHLGTYPALPAAALQAAQVTLERSPVMTAVALDIWRRLIGYVLQETMFFHASVAAEFGVGAPI